MQDRIDIHPRVEIFHSLNRPRLGANSAQLRWNPDEIQRLQPDGFKSPCVLARRLHVQQRVFAVIIVSPILPLTKQPIPPTSLTVSNTSRNNVFPFAAGARIAAARSHRRFYARGTGLDFCVSLQPYSSSPVVKTGRNARVCSRDKGFRIPSRLPPIDCSGSVGPGSLITNPRTLAPTLRRSRNPCSI